MWIRAREPLTAYLRFGTDPPRPTSGRVLHVKRDVVGLPIIFLHTMKESVLVLLSLRTGTERIIVEELTMSSVSEHEITSSAGSDLASSELFDSFGAQESNR